MAQYATEAVNTPVGDLEWVIISGDGKEDINGDPKYQASLVLDPENEKHQAFLDKVDAFWEANKPQGFKGKTPSSNGLYPHKKDTGEKDENGDRIYEETGKTLLATKTGTTYKDGKTKVIKVFNAKGAEVSLGDKKIANGSRGRIGCVMAIYATTDKSGKTIVNAGVTFYLNSLQLSKFVEYAGAGFDALDDDEMEDEDSFEGVGDMGGISDEESTQAEKPRLD